eukprot:ANDGO_02925.mRNA.1 hypothetical protein
MPSRTQYYQLLGRTRPWEPAPPRPNPTLFTLVPSSDTADASTLQPVRITKWTVLVVFFVSFTVNFLAAVLPLLINATRVQQVFLTLTKPAWTIPGDYLVAFWGITTGSLSVACALFMLALIRHSRSVFFHSIILRSLAAYMLFLVLECLWSDVFFSFGAYAAVLVIAIVAELMLALTALVWTWAAYPLVGFLVVPSFIFIGYLTALIAYFTEHD